MLVHAHARTFMEKPEGIMDFGHAYSVLWMRMPDSTSSIAFCSPLASCQQNEGRGIELTNVLSVPNPTDLITSHSVRAAGILQPARAEWVP